MTDDLISVIDLARQHSKRKQSVSKILKRLGIEPQRQRSTAHGGQVIAYITNDEACLVSAELNAGISSMGLSESEADSIPEVALAEQGVFYLLQLEPDHDPGRFKVGFAISLAERLRALRCSAPFAKVVEVWHCKRLWEKTAIDCVADGCERLQTEVFRTTSIETVQARCRQFFELMPKLKKPLD